MKDYLYSLFISEFSFIIRLWSEYYSIDLWIAVFGAFLFLGIDWIIYWASWIGHYEIAVEVGYRKSKRKKLYAYRESFWKDILLISITSTATNKTFMLYLNFLSNLLLFVSLIVSSFGCIAVMITHVAGWAFCLAVCPMIITLAVTTIVNFIPHLLFVPSEKKRYNIFK